MIEVNYLYTTAERSGRVVYEQEIQKRLKSVKLNLIEYVPSKINIKGVSFISRAAKRFLWFPHQLKKRVKKDKITHLTSEDFAYLLNFIKFKKVIITCHDLIPWVYNKERSLFLRLNMRGLKKADRIITVSNFSKNDLVKYLKYPTDKIDVITDAVDHSRYYQKRNKEILKKYNIPENEKVILFVGSEQKRQNLPFLIESFYELKKIMPEVKLLKIGNPQAPGKRKELLNLIKNLGLEKEVIFTGFAKEEDLPKFYNAADLFVYPCLYAGFGIPPLEAMACGTPVIASNLTSLPEVIGNAGTIINPFDKNQLVEAMYEVLTNKDLRENLINRGLERAKIFSWERAAKETLMIYEKVAISQWLKRS